MRRKWVKKNVQVSEYYFQFSKLSSKLPEFFPFKIDLTFLYFDYIQGLNNLAF